MMLMMRLLMQQMRFPIVIVFQSRNVSNMLFTNYNDASCNNNHSILIMLLMHIKSFDN